MLLDGKRAVVYGGGGAMGGAAAAAFAREGANVFLAGRTQSSLDRVAARITSAGGTAQTSVLDAMDPDAVDGHLDAVVSSVGGVDVCFNAVGLNDVQGTALTELPMTDFMSPIIEAARTHFITATAAARHMTQGSGVIMMLSSSAARESRFQMGGFSLACAAIECLTRTLAGEVGPDGIRVVALRPNFTPETHSQAADQAELEELVRGTALQRLPRLDEVADTAAYIASDHAGAITGAVINLTCGAIVD